MMAGGFQNRMVKLLLLVLAAGVAMQLAAVEVWSGDGMLRREPGQIPVLFMTGTPEAMGEAQGKLLKPEIHKMYERILLVAGGYLYTRNDWFFDRIVEIEKRSAAVLPERFLRELDAMSLAAGLTAEEGRQINLFPEMFHCSGIAVRGKASAGGKVIHARVLDYMRDIGIQGMAVIQVFMPDGFHSWLSVGFAGLNGTVTAMNAEGLAMGEMGGRGEGNWDGLPMSYLMRRIMEECATVDEALELIKTTPLTCEYYYVLSDRAGRMAAVAAKAGVPPQILGPGEATPLLCAAFEDIVWVTAPGRQPALSGRLRENYGKIDVEVMKQIITRPVAMKSNLQDAIFLPETLDVYFAYAGPKTVACDEPYTHLNLRELIDSYRRARELRRNGDGPAAAPVAGVAR